MYAHPKRGQKSLAGGGDISTWDRRLVSCADQFESAGLGIRKDALAIHGDAVALTEEAEAASFVRRSRHLRGGNGFKRPLHSLQHFDRSGERLSRTPAATRSSGPIDGTQQHLLAASAAGEQADADLNQSGVKF